MLGVDVNIIFTRQVKNEVDRNREIKIKEAMKQFKEYKLQFPNLCKGYKEYNDLCTLFKKSCKKHKELISKIETDIARGDLHAAKVLNQIFEKLTILEHDDEILQMAVNRYKMGNPPGKENSYGDSINWELLLKNTPVKEDLFFVSADKDFRSILNENKMNKFLENEWKEKVGSDIFLYTSLTMFFNDHIKDINLKTENEKTRLIDNLMDCGCFASTHSIVKRLSGFSHWTQDQSVFLFNVAICNNQVNLIINDQDIKEFFVAVATPYLNELFQYEEFEKTLEALELKDPRIVGFEVDSLEN